MAEFASLVVGEKYVHEDGREVIFICPHPHDGAYLIFEDIDGPDEGRPNLFGCERQQIIEP